MSGLSMLPLNIRLLTVGGLALAMLLGAAGIGWLVQGWRLGEVLADQGRELERQISVRDKRHADSLAQVQNAAIGEARRAQEKRLTLEHQLQASSQHQHRKLTDAENTAARLRDRLATAELRLSVLLASPGAAGAGHCGGVPASANAGCLVDGAARAYIDRGAAQRIVSIAERGDRAIIALGMCQSYVQTISHDEG